MFHSASVEGETELAAVREERPALTVLRLALPVMAEMLLHTLVWIVDTAMVGRLGADALSAVGLGAHVYWSIIFTVGGIGIGITALVARLSGAGEQHRARIISGQGLMMAIILGILLLISGWFLVPLVFSLANLGPAVTTLGTAYTRTVWMGAPCSVVFIVVSAALRGTGDTRTPMIATGAMNVVNAVLDYILIFGHLGFPAMGVQGAAVASLIAQVTGLTVAGQHLLRSDIAVRPGIGECFPLQPQIFARIVRVGLPASVETVLMEGARTVNLFLIAVLGTTSFAAFQVTIAAESLSFMPGHAFAVAATILTGQNLGKGRPDLARRDVGLCIRMAVIVMSTVGTLFLLIPGVFIRIFTPDVMVVALAAVCLRITSVMQPAIAMAEVYRGALRGAGDTRTPLRITVLSSWVLRVPLTLLLIRVLGFDIQVVFMIMVVEWWTRTILLRRMFMLGRWQSTAI